VLTPGDQQLIFHKMGEKLVSLSMTGCSDKDVLGKSPLASLRSKRVIRGWVKHEVP